MAERDDNFKDGLTGMHPTSVAHVEVQSITWSLSGTAADRSQNGPRYYGCRRSHQVPETLGLDARFQALTLLTTSLSTWASP